MTCSELSFLSITVKNLVKVCFVQIGETIRSLNPKAIFQNMCPEVLDAMGDVQDNIDKLSLPNWIWKLKINCVLNISYFKS